MDCIYIVRSSMIFSLFHIFQNVSSAISNMAILHAKDIQISCLPSSVLLHISPEYVFVFPTPASDIHNTFSVQVFLPVYFPFLRYRIVFYHCANTILYNLHFLHRVIPLLAFSITAAVIYHIFLIKYQLLFLSGHKSIFPLLIEIFFG